MAQTVPARQTVQNMTEGSPVSLILRFALPIFISQVFQQLYSTADAFIVGKYLGTNAFAAVSSSGTLIMLLTSLFIGTAMGAGVAISKYFGAGDYENVSRAIHTNLAFGIVSGTLLTLIGVFLTPTFLVWMNTDAQVMPQAVEYFRYYFLGVLATVLYNMCTSILNALGDSRRPLHYLDHFLACQHRARPAVHRRVPLGRLVRRRGDRHLSGHELRALPHPPAQKG